jgi:predicted PurR-regulated permease PerM
MDEKKVIVVLLAFLCLLAATAALHFMQSVLLPFVIALFLSYIFKPIIIELTRRRVPLGLAVVAVLLLGLALLGALSLVLVASARSFIDALPRYQLRMELLLGSVQSFIWDAAGLLGIPPSELRLSNVVDAGSLTGLAASGVGSFVSFFSTAFLVLFFFIFLMTGTGLLLRKADFLYSDERSRRIAEVFATVDRRVRQYMLTKTLISLANGLLATVILAALGVDFPVLWGIVMFFSSFIPNIGSLFATFFPVMIALLQFDTLTVPLLALALLVVSQNVMGNIVEPRVMAFSLNVSPLVVFASLIFWGWLWGVWGMILSVPIMAIVKIICENVPPLRTVAVLLGGDVPRQPVPAAERGA